MATIETIRGAGAAAARLYAEEFPGAAIDARWLQAAYEQDSAGAGWPDGSYDAYEAAAHAALVSG